MKNSILIVLFMFLLPVSQAGMSSAQEKGEGLDIKHEEREDGKKCVKATFILDGDPELIYNTLLQVEKFPEFMPGSAKVEILECGDNYQVVKFSGQRGMFSADIVMKRVIARKKKNRMEPCGRPYARGLRVLACRKR
jgi:hypothetical protein